MEILANLLGSAAKVKIIRLFLFNEESAFDLDTIVLRAKVTPKEAKRELEQLQKIELIKRKAFSKDEVHKKGKKTVVKRVHLNGWALDNKFPYLLALKNLLITVSLHKHEDLPKRLGGGGKIKLLVVAGVFIQDWESRVDMLIVGDGIRRSLLENSIKTLESEIGKELRYSIFETADFEYRLGIYDKLIRDILDFPHKKVINKLGLEG